MKAPDLLIGDIVYIIGLDMVEAKVLRIDLAGDINGSIRYEILCQDKYGKQHYYDSSQVVMIARAYQEVRDQPVTPAEYEQLNSILTTIRNL